MALKSPDGNDKLISVVMFPNQGKGYGYGVTKRGENGTLPEGYDRTINMSVRDGEILTPSFASTINQSIAAKAPAAWAIPWSDSSNTPIVVIGSGNYTYIVKNAAVTQEINVAHPDVAFTAVSDNGGSAKLTVGDSSTFAVSDSVVVTGSTVTGYNGTYTVSAKDTGGTNITINSTFSATATGVVTRSAEYGGACLWDDNATSGAVPYLWAGTKTGRKLLNYRTRAGVWAELSDTANNKGIYVAAGAGKLWVTPDDYHIKNFPSGTNPITGGSPSSNIAVGSNSAKITSLGVIGAVPVVGKEDGIWIYNTADTLFERAFEVAWNANNFPFMVSDGAGGLYTATADGAMVQIERFGTINRISPTADKPIGRDTPHGRIVDVTTTSDFGYALMDNGWRRNERVPGFTVLLGSGLTSGGYSGGVVTGDFTTAGTWTDFTALVTDGRDDTYLDLSGFDTIANGNALLIGASNKFLLTYFRMVGANTANARFRYAFLLTNTSGIEFSPFFNGTDSTPQSTSTPFAQSGFIATSADTQNLAANTSGWATKVVNGVTAYWIVIFTA